MFELQVCTVITTSYYAQACSLLQSLRGQHPDARLAVCIVDFDKRLAGRLQPGLDQVPLEALLPDRRARHRRLFRYSAFELCNSLKPLLLQHVLREHPRALYLDSDIRVVGSLGPVLEALAEGEILLSPHSLAPAPEDGRGPMDRHFLAGGIYNGGCVGVARGAAARAFLAWWAERLEAGCLREQTADQPWLTLVPLYFPPVVVLRHPGCNVAYWNLHARELAETSAGLVCNGAPLVFVHFSGYDPVKPDQLSRFQTRFELREAPLLARLCGEYRRALAEAPAVPDGARYGWGSLARGQAISKAMRRLYHARPQRFPEPFSPGFEPAFLRAWQAYVWHERLHRRLPWLRRWLGEPL